ncbi:DUF2953 domain-containing protein [Oceanobacillus senegalensis]|uniref:DUF2953 domain-containing protein n=1 Tax=Oceanobacillus senegalensis TaxID=1936063 RepID=UPI000A30C652|nr:DUF2953 domain-containing protein [Oceanobacillus senegalensis]
MLLLFVVVVLLPIFILLSLLIKVYVRIHYSFKPDNQQLQVSISLFKFRIFQRSIPLNDGIENTDFMKGLEFTSSPSSLEEWIKSIPKAIEALHSLLGKTKLHELSWSTLIGTGEASSTGVVSGAIWTMKGTLVGYLAEKFILMCNPTIQVNPKYQQEYIQTNLDCMVSIRIGKAIQAILQIKRIVKKA